MHGAQRAAVMVLLASIRAGETGTAGGARRVSDPRCWPVLDGAMHARGTADRRGQSRARMHEACSLTAGA